MNRTNRPVWLRYAVGVFITIIAAAIRWQFLEILELRATFLTFYPAVAVAALYGGFGPGLLATVSLLPLPTISGWSRSAIRYCKCPPT